MYSSSDDGHRFTSLVNTSATEQFITSTTTTGLETMSYQNLPATISITEGTTSPLMLSVSDTSSLVTTSDTNQCTGLPGSASVVPFDKTSNQNLPATSVATTTIIADSSDDQRMPGPIMDTPVSYSLPVTVMTTSSTSAIETSANRRSTYDSRQQSVVENLGTSRLIDDVNTNGHANIHSEVVENLTSRFTTNVKTDGNANINSDVDPDCNRQNYDKHSGENGDLSSEYTNDESRGEIKQAWADVGVAVEADKTSGEERIRALLAYMEEEKRKQHLETRKMLGTALDDIQEDDEEFKLSLDSRPNTQQETHRPMSVMSRPRSSRSRPVSGRSRSSNGVEPMNGIGEEYDLSDPPNSVRSENWYTPVRPPSVMDKNQAAGVTLESGGKYRILLPNDMEKCLVSGMTFLDSGDLVLADKGNQKVKFVDQKFEFISQVSLSEPWDLCSVGNEIYVSMGTSTIQHLFVKDMVLEFGKTFEMCESCYGIANFNNGIAVGLKTSEIHLMNTDGEVKRIIKIPKTEKGRQMRPWHLSVTNKFDILVTDPNIRTVCCLNSKGELLFRYPDMSNPRATVSDSSGTIFLVGLNKDTNLVMQILRKSGESVICVKSIVHLEDVEFEPNAISLRKSDGLLVLAGMRHALKRYKIV